MLIHCPSGLIFTARSWTLGDHGALIKAKDRSAAKLPQMMASLAAEEVLDPGPYPFEPGSKPNFELVSHADIIAANILIRASRDSHLLLTMICAVCRKLPEDPQDIDLCDLPVFMASEEGKLHLQTNEPVIREIGRTQVSLRALRGRDLTLIGKLQSQEPQSMLEFLPCLAIAELNAPGLKQPITDLHSIRKFWRDQDWGFRDAVESAVDELWGGVDLTVRFTCPRFDCQAEQEQALPLGVSFYGLEDPKRQSRRASSSSVVSVRELMQKASSPSSPESQESPASTSQSPRPMHSQSG